MPTSRYLTDLGDGKSMRWTQGHVAYVVPSSLGLAAYIVEQTSYAGEPYDFAFNLNQRKLIPKTIHDLLWERFRVNYRSRQLDALIPQKMAEFKSVDAALRERYGDQ